MPKWTKHQREYIRFTIGDLSLRRFTEREIVQEFLNKKPPIKISKTHVGRIRKSIEQRAEKWFTELRDSKYKYLATYKDRIDSLFKYQKMLHDLIQDKESDIDKVKAIAELHHIEISLKNIYKEVPDIGITKTEDNNAISTEDNNTIPEIE